jgi:hypothetical protein
VITKLRTIGHELSIRAPDSFSAEIFRYIAASPVVNHEQVAALDLNIGKTGGFYRLALASGTPAEGTALQILGALHRLHFDLTRREFPLSALVHAGVVTTDEGHVAFVGGKGAGKSTLLVYLASRGWPVTADEHLIIRADDAIPRPRSFRIKNGTLAHLGAGTAELVRRSPSVRDWQGAPVYAVEPSAFGRDWIIRAGRIRHLVVLRPNHGGRPRLRRLSHDRTLETILPDVLMPEQQRAEVFGRMRGMVLKAECFELWTGQLEEIPELLYQSIGLRF